MKHIENHHWNEKIVMAYLEEAADIHRRLPEVKMQGYYSLWPETLKDDWERFYDAVHGRTRMGPPMPQEVTFHEEIMAWLRLVDRYHQQIIWMRANRIPWKIISSAIGKGKATLWRELKNGLNQIVAILNSRQDAHEYMLKHVSTCTMKHFSQL